MLTESFKSKIERFFLTKKKEENRAYILTGVDFFDWEELAKRIFSLIKGTDRSVVPTIENLRENPDFIWVENQKNKKTITIGQIREVLKKISLTKQSLSRRVVMIPQAELMNKNAQNALLKILEEPPTACFFLLGAVFKNQLLPTIVSRCQHLENRLESKKSLSSIEKPEREEISVWSEENPIKTASIEKNLIYWRELKEFYSEILSQDTNETYKKIEKLIKDQPQKVIDLVRLIILEEKNKLRQDITNKDFRSSEARLSLISDFFEILRQLESNMTLSPKSALQIIITGIKTLV